MSDDPSERIALLEADIERLAGVAEGCLKFILAAKVAIVLGGLTLLATTFGIIGFDQLVLLGSIAAILGGIVTAGSNSATLGQVRTDMRAAERLRTELIDRIEFPS